MGDYADLCEMYGRDASDPDFIDDLIDEISYENSKYETDDDWLFEDEPKSHYDTLAKHLDSVDTLCKLECPKEAEFSLLVMLHGHLVSAIEGYLAGVFINTVTNSEELIRKLVETDPEFSKRTFTMKEIFEKKSSLKETVASYLKDLIFHDLKKIKPMYKDVLGIDFGDIGWLFKAVQTRHHCVHRAGYDKDGNEVSVCKSSIKELTEQIDELVNHVEGSLDNLARL